MTRNAKCANLLPLFPYGWSACYRKTCNLFARYKETKILCRRRNNFKGSV